MGMNSGEQRQAKNRFLIWFAVIVSSSFALFSFMVAVGSFLRDVPQAQAASIPLVNPRAYNDNFPTAYEVPAGLRNVFPAENFNRNVTTTWWSTEVLDGHSTKAAAEASAALANASFIILDKDMYQVFTSICFYRQVV